MSYPHDLSNPRPPSGVPVTARPSGRPRSYAANGADAGPDRTVHPGTVRGSPGHGVPARGSAALGNSVRAGAGHGDAGRGNTGHGDAGHADTGHGGATEHIDGAHADLDLRATDEILDTLLDSQRRALGAVAGARDALASAVAAAAARLESGEGRLVYAGAGASGRIAVQDGAELWPTFGWPHARLLLCMAGGERALTASAEGVEDDADAARAEVAAAGVGAADVVVALAASGRSAWTCAWLEAARGAGALAIGIANNAGTPLLEAADCPVWLDTGAEVLAGSTRMTAGTAQKIALNSFGTTLMIRLNRTWGNLMVDMVAVNEKLDGRRVRLLQGVLPTLDDTAARAALAAADGWVKLAALIALGEDAEAAHRRLDDHRGSLRQAIAALGRERG